jgi:hypothetical protein
MIGKSYIDNWIDLFSTYGIYITYGGYNSLISYPPLKKTESIDWPEEDGEQVDLSTPVLDVKEVTISFAAKSVSQVGLFFEKLCTGSYHAFILNEIGQSFLLRLVSNPNLKLDADGNVFLFSLTFSDDFPILVETFDYVPPSSTANLNQPGYSLDGIPLTQYGITILDGSNAEILKSPQAKLNKLRSFAGLSGLRDDQTASTYDSAFVYFKSKEVTLKCLLQAADLTEFWINYNAFLYNLIQPGEREFEGAGVSNQCFYKSSSVGKFFSSGSIWCEFTLTLQFLNYRITEEAIS